MAFPVWLNNLIAYSLQIAILAAAGTLLAYLFRLRVPRVTLIYWQLLLLVCLAVPFLQSWQRPIIGPPINEANTFIAIENPVVTGTAVLTNVEPAKPIQWRIIPLVLAGGVVLRLLWLAIGFFRLGFFRRKSHLFVEEHSVIQAMQWRTGVRVTVLLSSAVHSPVTFGLRSPTIILPLSFRELSVPCKQAILCHEFLHVRRYDWLHIIIEEFVRSIFWFHPAIWWLLSRVHLSREQAVDHEVVQLTGGKQPYLDSLLEFARTHSSLNAVPAPLFLREHHLVQRVALLLKEVSMSRSRLTVSMIGITALLVNVFYLAAGWFPLTGSPVFAQVQNANTEVKVPQEVPTTVVVAPMPDRQRSAKSEAKSTQSIPVLITETRASTPGSSASAQSNPPQKQPIIIGGNAEESRLIYRVEPVYPELARNARVQGKVVLTVITDEEGNVVDVKVVHGHPLLVEAAVTAVKQWKYSPTFLNGKPVPVMATVTVVFRLDADHNAPAQKQPIGVAGNIAEPRLVHRVEPKYPELAKRARVQGKVILGVTVDEEGNVVDVKVVSGHPWLTDPAVTAVRQWKYAPTLLNGVAVPVMATVTVIFNLDGGNDLMVWMDESGNLNVEQEKMLQTNSRIRILINPSTPFRVAESVLRDLMQKGVKEIDVVGPYAFYQGQLFYVNFRQADWKDSRLARALAVALEANNQKQLPPLAYRLYLSEAGEAVGLQRFAGIEVPLLEQELMLYRGEPMMLSGEPVPSVMVISIFGEIPPPK
jgi:TonB family protein